MKMQQKVITYSIILSSILLSSYRAFTDHDSAFISASTPTNHATEIMQLSEAHDTISLVGDSSNRMGSRSRPYSIANKSYKIEETSVSEPTVKYSDYKENLDHGSKLLISPISRDLRLDEGFVTRLPMEDQYHSQIKDTSLPNACGPTSLMMALDYFELERSLDEVIQKLQLSPTKGGYDPTCTTNPVCTSPAALVHVAREEYGLLVDAHEGWTFDEIHESIAAGQPIIADIVWRLKDEGPGHFVIIYGIDIQQKTLFYHDPYDGAEMAASWDEFSVAWDGPVDLGDPIQPQGYAFWGMSLTTG
jgi:uncharacterized protein YvpB